MGAVYPRDFSWRRSKMPALTGGLTFTQNGDKDAVLFDNVEMLRDQYIRPRSGYRLGVTLGGAQVLGMALASAAPSGTASDNWLVMACTDALYVLLLTNALAGNYTPTKVTWATAPGGTNAVDITGGYDASDNAYVIMACADWTGLQSWDGTSGSTAAIAGSPASAIVHFHDDKRVYAVPPNKNALSVSDIATPTSWPSANLLGISSSYGRVRRMASQAGNLLLLCEKGIQYLTGDPTQNPYVGTINPDVGGSSPLSICSYGNDMALYHRGNVYQLVGQLSVLTDALKGILPADNAGMGLGPFNVLLRPQATADAYMYDRFHYGAWTHYTYSNGPLSVSPTFPLVQYVDELNTYALNGNDGNVYFQDTWTLRNAQSGTSPPPDTTTSDIADSGGSAVRPRIITRPYDLGDSLLIKIWRCVTAFGYGSNVSLTMNLFDYAGNKHAINMGTGLTLPFEVNTPSVDGTSSSPYTEFAQVQFDISGDYLYLKDLVLEWRPCRYGLLQYS